MNKDLKELIISGKLQDNHAKILHDGVFMQFDKVKIYYDERNLLIELLMHGWRIEISFHDDLIKIVNLMSGRVDYGKISKSYMISVRSNKMKALLHSISRSYNKYGKTE